jgi:hypothetical protein
MALFQYRPALFQLNFPQFSLGIPKGVEALSVGTQLDAAFREVTVGAACQHAGHLERLIGMLERQGRQPAE